MKNHTLMQTIARANRVFPEKTNGLIVDYIGVFRNLEAALAIYAAPKGDGSLPVKDKTELVAWLRSAIDTALGVCRDHGVDIDQMLTVKGFDLVKAVDDAVELLIVDDETKIQFIAHARLVDRLFKAILPDPEANEFGPVRAVLVYLAECIAKLNPTVDVSHVLGQVEVLLDDSVAANAYLIHAPPGEGATLIDLNEVDWDTLAAKFAAGKKRTEAEKLRAAVAAKVAVLASLNPTRVDWAERFQKLIDEYNAGSVNVEEFFARLVEFTKELNEEERRGLAEHLDEEQLAVYDLLMRPAPELTEAERKQVKKVAESLLELLKREKSSSSIGARNSKQGRQFGSPSRRPSTSFPTSSRPTSTNRNATPSTSTSSTATGTTATACTTRRRERHRRVAAGARAVSGAVESAPGVMVPGVLSPGES